MTLFEPIANLRYYTHLSQIAKKGNLLCPIFPTEPPYFLLKRTESPNHFYQNMLQAISLKCSNLCIQTWVIKGEMVIL